MEERGEILDGRAAEPRADNAGQQQLCCTPVAIKNA